MADPANRIIAAMGLPASAILDQRIAKKVLAGQAATAAGDRKLLLERIEQVTWKAVLKPNTIGIPGFSDAEREYREISVLVARLRGSGRGDRIGEIIQRAIPYPIVLVMEDQSSVRLWLATKRKSESKPDELVVTENHVSPEIDFASPAASGFLSSLALSAQPHEHLLALYEGWTACVTGLRAASHTGKFSGPMPSSESREALAAIAELAAEIQLLTTRATKEKQLNRRVDLNLGIKCLEARLASLSLSL